MFPMIVKRKQESLFLPNEKRDLNSFIKLGPFSFLMNLYRCSWNLSFYYLHIWIRKRFIKFIYFFLPFTILFVWWWYMGSSWLDLLLPYLFHFFCFYPSTWKMRIEKLYVIFYIYVVVNRFDFSFTRFT